MAELDPGEGEARAVVPIRPQSEGRESPEQPPTSPFPTPPSRRALSEELLVVLSLTFLASAVFAVIDLLSAPLAGISVSLYANVSLANQLVSIVFGLAPVWLIFYLIRRNAEGLRPFGLDTTTLRADVGWGLLGGLGVAAVGLAIYLAAVALKVNRFVVPVPPLGHWWTVPVLVLGATQTALAEEVIVTGYLIRRLEQLRWPGLWPVAASAVLRCTYHLYQGWGGFAGNLALGLAFGYAFRRWRRTWPLVTAHFMVDVLSGVGYIAFHGHCFFHTCIR
jgi:membrane protease YdiL (CAAX protease family)